MLNNTFKKYLLFQIIIVVLFLITPNHAYSQDIKTLERQLEYLKKKQVLDAQLKLIQAKLASLNEQYKDVASSFQKTKPVASSSKDTSQKRKNTSSLSKTAVSPAKVSRQASTSSANRVWKITSVGGSCVNNMGMEVEQSTIDKQGNLRIDVSSTTGQGWNGSITGNLQNKKLKLDGSAGGEYFDKFKFTKDGNGFQVKALADVASRRCLLTFRIE